MTSYLKAKYIGHEGEAGYQSSHTYFLEVRQHWFGKITIRPTHGYTFKPLDDMQCTYQNLKTFLHSWKVLHVVDPFAE